MPRIVTAAACQMGPNQRDAPRREILARMIELMRQAKAAGAHLVVFPELALTTFFARFLIEDETELDSYFEKEVPGPGTRPLFEEASRLGLAFYLGYGELAVEDGRKRRYNTSVLVDAGGTIRAKYRKVHLPGYAEVQQGAPFQHLEKRYFDVGDRGFQAFRALDAVVGMCICNDRRWPETYRVLGLQGVELTLIGYNTAAVNYHGAEPSHLRMFHNHLSMQAGAYENSTYVVAAAKCGVENGVGLIGGSCIIAPSGEIAALAQSEGDEVIVARCDLDQCAFGKRTMFDFAAHRRPEHYRRIVEQVGAAPPDS